MKKQSNTDTVPERATKLESPRFEKGKALVIAGLREHFDSSRMDELPALWQRFAPHIGKIPGQVGQTAYGVIFSKPGAEGIDYLAGVEVSESAQLPSQFRRAKIPAQTYAAFPHRDHVSKVRNTVDAIFNKWLPKSGRQHSRKGPDAPDFFERYSKEFNPETGMGGIEVWVPIEG